MNQKPVTIADKLARKPLKTIRFDQIPDACITVYDDGTIEFNQFHFKHEIYKRIVGALMGKPIKTEDIRFENRGTLFYNPEAECPECGRAQSNEPIKCAHGGELSGAPDRGSSGRMISCGKCGNFYSLCNRCV